MNDRVTRTMNGSRENWMGHENDEWVTRRLNRSYEKQFNHQLYADRGAVMDRISFGKKILSIPSRSSCSSGACWRWAWFWRESGGDQRFHKCGEILLRNDNAGFVYDIGVQRHVSKVSDRFLLCKTFCIPCRTFILLLAKSDFIIIHLIEIAQHSNV